MLFQPIASFLRRFRERLSRQVTVLIIPDAELKPWRWSFSAGFIVFCLTVWSGFTLWAGYISGRHVDYWITKADNQVMRTKVSYLLAEFDRSKESLDAVRATDRQLRSLLSLNQKQEVVEATAVGGPTALDGSILKRLLSGERIDQAAWRRQLATLREESHRRLASFQEISWYISNQKSLFHATPSVWPTAGQITSLFGYRFAPTHRADGETGEYHQGIDIANNPDTLIVATADGTVRFAGWAHGYGWMILIDHGYGVSTLYAHTSKALVKKADRVARGQLIAYMGTTGRSTGAHLHYEVWRHGKPVNPMAYLKVRPGEERLAAGGRSAQASGR